MNFIRSNKPELIEAICTDASFVLQRVEKKKLITRREYTILSQKIDQDVEKGTIGLLDKLMNKDDQHCKEFISILGEDETLKTFPGLGKVLCPAMAPQQVAVRTPATDTPIQEAGLDKTYEMVQIPRGLCVIINNVNFKKSGERKGSDTDADTLDQVFTWLGFMVKRHRNKTAAEMKAVLQECRQSAFGDCFICCALSHGESKGILGCDDDILTIEEILIPFKGCPELAGKPKLFFIQACRGNKFPDEVLLTTDTGGEVAQELDTDVRPFQMRTIPADADFLVSMATVDNYYSMRHPTEGSWFIQSLCRQLREGAQRGDDILTILTRVNDDVCQEEGFVRGKKAKQAPDQSFRLRKKLVLPVP